MMNNLRRISEIAKELNCTTMTVRRYLNKLNINPYRSAGGLFLLSQTQAKELLDFLIPTQKTINEQSNNIKKPTRKRFNT